MRKKKTLYIMLPIILLVWGGVFYQLYGYFFSSPVYKNIEEKQFVNIEEIKQDTFSIVANYRDPFLGGKVKLKKTINNYNSKSNVNNNRKKQQKIIKADQPWPTIKYSGMIKNNNSNWKVGIIKVNGKEHLVKEGLLINDLKIIKIEKKAIKVRFQRENKVIEK